MKKCVFDFLLTFFGSPDLRVAPLFLATVLIAIGFGDQKGLIAGTTPIRTVLVSPMLCTGCAIVILVIVMSLLRRRAASK